MPGFRTEKDPLGEKQVPSDALYGVQTLRAMENFPISGMTAPPELVTATVQIKKAAAAANRTLGRLDPDIAAAIIAAADEVLAGGLRDQFVVDVYQAGAGTSHNMNVNEVLANRAAEILGSPRGTYERVHPNDHVNMGQSTNDVFPTATRLALLAMLPGLFAAARELAAGLAAKAAEFDGVLKTGRTHLQDAVPMTLGQELGGYAANVAHAAKELERTAKQLLELSGPHQVELAEDIQDSSPHGLLVVERRLELPIADELLLQEEHRQLGVVQLNVPTRPGHPDLPPFPSQASRNQPSMYASTATVSRNLGSRSCP